MTDRSSSTTIQVACDKASVCQGQAKVEINSFQSSEQSLRAHSWQTELLTMVGMHHTEELQGKVVCRDLLPFLSPRGAHSEKHLKSIAQAQRAGTWRDTQWNSKPCDFRKASTLQQDPLQIQSSVKVCEKACYLPSPTLFVRYLSELPVYLVPMVWFPVNIMAHW